MPFLGTYGNGMQRKKEAMLQLSQEKKKNKQ